MATFPQQKLEFLSRPYERRVALIPMTIGIMLAWFVLACFIGICVILVRHAMFAGWITIAITAALIAYLIYLTRQWMTDGDYSYQLVIEGNRITLSSVNFKQSKIKSQEMLLSDINSAEYYEPRDVASLLLRADHDEIEIPLWSFGPDVEKRIIDFMKSKGVKITKTSM